jgi:hypothetical protein
MRAVCDGARRVIDRRARSCQRDLFSFFAGGVEALRALAGEWFAR